MLEPALVAAGRPWRFGELAQTADQALPAAAGSRLAGCWATMRLASAYQAMIAGIDAVGLLEDVHAFGEAAHRAWVGDGTGHALRPTTGRRAASRIRRSPPSPPARPGAVRQNAARAGDAFCSLLDLHGCPVPPDPGVQLLRGNIHSTNDLGHGNLPCAYDWEPSDCSVVRDTATVPKLTHGCCLRGYGRRRRARGPVATDPRAALLSSRRSAVSRYKGGRACEFPALVPPSPRPSPRWGEGARISKPVAR